MGWGCLGLYLRTSVLEKNKVNEYMLLIAWACVCVCLCVKLTVMLPGAESPGEEQQRSDTSPRGAFRLKLSLGLPVLRKTQ